MGNEEFEPGSRFRNLEIIREIGRGTYGVVYEAFDSFLRRRVALKTFRLRGAGAGAAERRRALSEARLIGRVNSPHVVTLYQVHIRGDDALVFEMELVQGGTLESRMGKDPGPGLPPEDSLRIVQHLARGLQAVHEAGIIHGDVKPANVLLDAAGNAKLADFGLGRPLPETSLTASGQGPAGTPRYMAPEVMMGAGPSRASDVWSLAVVIYELVAGRQPFQFSNLFEFFSAIQNAEPAPLPVSVPDALAELVLRCLTKDPRERPAELEAVALAAEESPRAPKSAPPAPRASAPLPMTRMFGRGTEQARLSELLKNAAEGRGRGVLVSGDAGIGKTTLVRSLITDARRRGCHWIETTLSPLLGLVRPLLDGLREAQVGSSRSSSSAIESREQMLWNIEHLLEKLSRQAPIVLVVEDAHQASEEDLRLLADLALRRSATPSLLIVTYRLSGASSESSGAVDTVGYQQLMARDAFEHIALGGLTSESLIQLLEEIGRAPLHQAVSREILRSSQGNAFFAVEMLRNLIDAGAVVEQDRELVPGPGWKERRLPRRVRDLVTRRFARLGEDQRDLLDVAAVDGFGFDGEAVASILDRPLLEVLRSLQRLHRDHALIAPQRNGYSFAHPLIQEVLYEDAAPVLRRAIHRGMAEHYEKRYHEQGTDPERVGTHWEQAGEAGRAAPFLLEAVIGAYRRMEIGRVQDLCRRAGWTPEQFGPAQVAQHPEAAMDFATCLADGGHYDQAAGVFEAIADAARETEDRQLELRALCKRSKSLYHARGVKALDVGQLEVAARELTEPRHEGLAWYCLGLAARASGEIPRTREVLAEAKRCYREAGYDAGHSDVLDLLATLASDDGDLEEATHLYAEAARLANRAGRRVNAAISEVNSSLAALRRGTFEGLESRLQHAITVCDLEGSTAAAHARLVLAHSLLALGRTAESRKLVRQAHRSSEQAGFSMGCIYADIAEAQFALMAWELDEAERSLQSALERASAIGVGAVGLYALAIQLELHCVRGEFERAEALLEEKLPDLRRTPPLVRSETLSGIAEVVLFGMSPVPLADPALHDGILDSDLRILDAARAWVWQDGGVRELEDAAATLLGPRVGLRRSIRRIVGHRLRAEALWRSGEFDAARDEARTAVLNARELGHVAHTRTIESWLAEHPEA